MAEPRPAEAAPALTLGTAGHIDHGKTTLVAALTGTDTDRLAEERRRGISIELGFAELDLPGRALSVVDVPGHHRLVRAMVAGAGGIDLFLLAIAADDGVMPQTREHWTVLCALGIDRGVIALTKCDAAPEESLLLARAEAEALAPGVPVVEVSARTGAGLDELRGAIGAVAESACEARDPGPAWPPRPPVLHIDRAFTLRGIGTVVTGTLRSGALDREQQMRILPSERATRVRSVEVHGRRVETAGPGRRVAVNLAGIDRADVRGGDVVTAIESGLVPSYRLDVSLDFDPAALAGARRVQVHHGTRDAPARLVDLGGGLAQLRLESPLIAEPEDRLVIRRIAPPGTVGGGIVIDPFPSRHGPGAAVAGLTDAVAGEPSDVLRRAIAAAPDGLPAEPAKWLTAPLLGFALARHGEPEWIDARDRLVRGGEATLDRGVLRAACAEPVPPGPPEPAPLDDRAAAVLRLLDADGLQPRLPAALAAELGITRAEAEAGVAALVAAGRAVRLRGDVVYPSERLERIVGLVTGLARARGSISLAELRDDLRISRKYSQAIIEHLDGTKVTIRHGDRHVLRRPR